MLNLDWSTLLNGNRIRPSKGRTSNLDLRNPFESDFGRIVFSPALRRMHDKTQAFPLTINDNIHSRLTHSIEVMEIGHSLAIDICNQDYFISSCLKFDKNESFRLFTSTLRNACLVHDIGNPPFGHFGETVIQNYFKNIINNKLLNDSVKDGFSKLDSQKKMDFEEFDGNAQGFRILTKLQMLDDLNGLNLTAATLSSFIKYPNYDKPETGNTAYVGKHKRGIFFSEISQFQKICSYCGLQDTKENKYYRHPLSYLMEAADSICYYTMDIEDGFNTKLFKLENLLDKLSLVNNNIIDNDNKKSESFTDSISNLKKETNTISKMVKLRNKLIQTLMNRALNNFKENYKAIMKGQYNNELLKDTRGNNQENDLEKYLSEFCKENIFTQRSITTLELTGYSVISGLLTYFLNLVFNEDLKLCQHALQIISRSIVNVGIEEHKKEYNSLNVTFDKLNPYYKFKVVLDYISGMTDNFALNLYQKLSGQIFKL